jgi:hypothetical protein
LGLRGSSVAALLSWKRVGDGAGDDEKSCRNLRRGDGPGCFGVVRAGPYRGEFLYRIDFIRERCEECVGGRRSLRIVPRQIHLYRDDDWMTR